MYWRNHSPVYVPQEQRGQVGRERQWPGREANAGMETEALPGRSRCQVIGDDVLTLPAYRAEEPPPKYQLPAAKLEDIELPDYAESAVGSNTSLSRPSPSRTA